MNTLTRKRGRPRINRPMNDTGTPELVMKRLQGVTSETLDAMLERGVITQQQHWCGIHLRWLYTLRFGAPGVRAIDPMHFGGVEVKADDPEWRTLREAEYNEALALLKPRLANVLLAVAVFNERIRNRHVDRLREGLHMLGKHWQR